MSKRKTDSERLREIADNVESANPWNETANELCAIARRVARDTKRLKWFCDGRISGRDLRASIDAAMQRERKEKR